MASSPAVHLLRPALVVTGLLLVLTCISGYVRAEDQGLALELESYTLSLVSKDKLELSLAGNKDICDRDSVQFGLEEVLIYFTEEALHFIHRKVVITTPDGLPNTPSKVSLLSAHLVGSDSAPLLSNKDFESIGDGKFTYDFLSSKISVGKYKLRIEAKPVGTAKGILTTVITVTAPISVSNVQLAVVDSGAGVTETEAGLDYNKKETATLSASHLQKLKLSFELKLPSGAPFRPQQVFLKLRHETGVEHLYLLKLDGKKFELTLDFLGMVEKLNYLSGIYAIELIVGDDIMENPFVWTIAFLDLDLPEGPGGATQPSELADTTSRFGPKPEISHIFRQPEKRPPTYLSMTFFVLTLLPLIGFLVGLQLLGANLRLFPSGGLPLVSAIGFHGGVAGILALYFLFWLKLNLFTTLQALGFLGLFTLVPGFNILSYLADLTSKVKMS